MEEKEYWSNCLVEALIAKLLNWKNTKIFFIPGGRDKTCSHFVWLDIENEIIKDFHTEEISSFRWWNFIWWKGYIRELDYRTWVRWSTFGRRDF